MRGEYRRVSGHSSGLLFFSDCSSQTYYCFLCCRRELSLSPSLYLFLSNFSPLGARVPASISRSFSASHLPPVVYYSFILSLHRNKAGGLYYNSLNSSDQSSCVVPVLVLQTNIVCKYQRQKHRAKQVLLG